MMEAKFNSNDKLQAASD
jgi:hypothetical protein